MMLSKNQILLLTVGLAGLAAVVLVLILLIGKGSKPVSRTSDDGTEVDGKTWFEEGYEDNCNYIGRYKGASCKVGLRFRLNDLNEGDTVSYAQLRFPSSGSRVSSTARLIIEGLLQESPTTFSSDDGPSQKNPKTINKIPWEISEDWIEGTARVPLYYSSPDIAPIINEILAVPGWGKGPEGKVLILTLKYDSPPREDDYVSFVDYSKNNADQKSTAGLEVYRSVYDTFLGKELLGRITDTSVTVNLYSLMETDACVEYGTSPGVYTHKSDEHLGQRARKGYEITLENLVPNTRYYYRLMFRKAGEKEYDAAAERTFHTQRPRGSSFSFAVIADEHIQNACKLPQSQRDKELYRLTLENMGKGNHDFFISMGDFANTEFYEGRNADTFEEAMGRYLLQREYIDRIAHSLPFFLVIGNHEGENGWYYRSTDEREKRLAVNSTLARKQLILNPRPDGFYRGNEDRVREFGLREDYYAWEWGDALFVVLSPFWYTRIKPHLAGPDDVHASNDGWDWTLGKKQYNWLYETLHGSQAKWKFVFIHHLTSTTSEHSTNMAPCYGRGGIEVAKHKVAGNPSFEWGGENEKGRYVLASKRPGWNHGAVHDMLVAEKVDILFHGHDHFYAKQELDGVIYQECPQPIKSMKYCYRDIGQYRNGELRPNAGYLSVSVDPMFVKVEYIRTFISKKGMNGKRDHTYTLKHSKL